MKTLPPIVLAFYTAVFSDLVVHSPTYKSCCTHSKKYLFKRLLSEGISFASNSLPTLGKAVETSVITGKAFVCPTGFSRHWRSSLPNFMFEYFDVLFSNDGIPIDLTSMDLDDPVGDRAFAFWAIRQVCSAFSKAEGLGCKMSDEEALKAFEARITSQEVISAPTWVLDKARRLIKDVVGCDDALDPMLEMWDLEPYGKHGPGAVAEKEKGLAKWNFSRIPGLNERLYLWRLSDPSEIEENGVRGLTSDAAPVSRAICVPKDFRSPRIICIEPKEFQFAQQGLWDVLRRVIEKHPLAGRAINFEHQEYNGRLCQRDDLSTIDLKDASDRVMLRLCRYLFPKRFFALVTRYRSRGVDLNGRILKPTCFASMGSALCFPVETLVFWAIAQASLDPGDYKKPIRVFGDDIIVPTGSVHFVIKMLEACGLKVNEGKTCINTPVRESCGAYTYAGRDVRITRFKSVRTESLPEWLSIYQNGKELHSRLLTNAALAVLRLAKDTHHVPFGHDGLPADPRGFACQSRWNRQLQRREFWIPSMVTPKGSAAVPGLAGLYAWLIGNSTKPSSYGNQKVKMKWVNLPTL